MGQADDGSRIGNANLREWILLNGNRYLLSAGVSAGVFVLCLFLGLGEVLAVERSGPVKSVAAAVIAGTITLITVVLAINQLVLSGEFGTPGDLNERFEEMRRFRKQVEELTKVDNTPATPSDFLRVLVWDLREHAVDLREMSSKRHNAELHEEILVYTEDVTRNAKRVYDILEHSQFETFGSLTAVLDYNLSEQLYIADYFQNTKSSALSKSAKRTLEEIQTLLKFIDVSRQYFKTLYMQRELANLSRVLLYVGFPAVVVQILTVLTVDRLLTIWTSELTRSVAVSAFVTVSLLPLTVLLTYVLRIATVAYRTASFGPFIPQKEQTDDRVTGSFDVELVADEE